MGRKTDRCEGAPLWDVHDLWYEDLHSWCHKISFFSTDIENDAADDDDGDDLRIHSLKGEFTT